MKFSLLAAALVAITLVACDRPKQANPESIEDYGTTTEEGTTMAEERAASGPVSEVADTTKFELDNAMQAEEAAEIAAAAEKDAAAATADEKDEAAAATADEKDEAAAATAEKEGY